MIKKEYDIKNMNNDELTGYNVEVNKEVNE